MKNPENETPESQTPENPDPDENPWSRRRWLARFSYSFLIVGLYLAYTGYQGAQQHTLSQFRVILFYFSAMLAFVMFFVSVRSRQR